MQNENEYGQSYSLFFQEFKSDFLEMHGRILDDWFSLDKAIENHAILHEGNILIIYEQIC